ncbi:hypothetical protein FGSG_00619 [Fusarium graminearum PH-1]|uniref:Uncharacterized protein n=2 Tax=Gibberella zeae TaxID=5518 RepID=I1RAT3_GIBZE|nr:hypothetical protein FGSG_00619 [Fusarium graminearum PH-1]ESU05825.1 hypothetical protein FGSG_00619 [Fusarium graminearum PH-1]|eukprot:XP_011316310.1 hypothetical protein FGSG_00619 [Fusarium graminearum PH-1]
MAARVLITFMTLGTLEPLRCSRWDIEACGLGMFTYCCVFCDEGPGPWASVEMGAVGLCVMGALVECLLWIKVGHFVCWPALWLTSDNISVSDMLIRISALSPLIDIVETYTRYSHKLFVATTYLIFPYIMGILLQALSDAGKHGTWNDTEGFGQGARSVKNGTGLG